jgi:hypothetical protein
VVHGADYVDRSIAELQGRVGRSLGCFAFEQSKIDEILDVLHQVNESAGCSVHASSQAKPIEAILLNGQLPEKDANGSGGESRTPDPRIIPKADIPLTTYLRSFPTENSLL